MAPPCRNARRRRSCVGRHSTWSWLIAKLCLVLVSIASANEVTKQESVDATATSAANAAPAAPVVARDEHGILVAEALEHLEDFFRNGNTNDNVNERDAPLLMLVLVYADSCPHSLAVRQRFQDAFALVQEYFATTTDALNRSQEYDARKPPLVFAMVQASHADPVTLEVYGITSFPTMVFFGRDVTVTDDNNNKDHFLLVYASSRQTSAAIFQTALHYYYRLVVAAGRVQYTAHDVHVSPKHFADLEQVQAFVTDHRQGLLGNSVVEPALSPDLSTETAEYIRWLLYSRSNRDNETDHTNAADDFVLFVQCRSSNSNSEGQSAKREAAFFHESFHMARALSARRDRLFVTVSDCGDAVNGSVVAYKLSLDFDFRQNDWNTVVPKATFDSSVAATAASDGLGSQDLVEFLIKVSTPSVLWFDRQATAPIAFAVYRKVHAVLFIDLHHVDEGYDAPLALKTRRMIRHFQETCRAHWRADETAEQDMVCLVIPSTETRVLTTFGIDIWSVLHQSINQSPDLKDDGEPLPSLMITDQRSGGTKRYSLDSSKMDTSDSAIANFVASFWQGQLTPHIKSSKRGARTNASGVRILTGDSFRSELLHAPENQHALVFFSAPTCGHCKRFSILWNELAKLITHIGWNSFLTVYKMDVTTNEIVDLDKSFSVKGLPDVYYFSPTNRTHPTRHDLKDEVGEGVGRLANAMEIMQWLIHTAGDFDEEQLGQLLLDLNGGTDEEVSPN